MGGITTVKIKKKTRDELAKIGAKKETYNDIIQRLIDFYVEKNGGRPSGR